MIIIMDGGFVYKLRHKTWDIMVKSTSDRDWYSEWRRSRGFQAYSKAHWKRIRTTNVIERINKELKRRSRPVGAFPRDKSLKRLAGCVLIYIKEEWMTG